MPRDRSRTRPAVSARRLVEHLARDDELADVVQEPAGGQAAEPPGGKPELLSDLDREARDASCVLLGRAVLLGERDEQRAHVRAEERLLRRDEVGATEIAPQRPGPVRRAAAKVERDGDPDGGDACDLESVAEPPAEVREVVDERADERRAEPAIPTATARSGTRRVRRYVRSALVASSSARCQADGEDSERERAARLGDGRDERRATRIIVDPEHEDSRRADDERRQERANRIRPPEPRQRPEGEDHATDGKRRAAREGDDAVHVDEDPRCRRPVEAEEGGHEREGEAGEDRARVGESAPATRERERRGGRHRRCRRRRRRSAPSRRTRSRRSPTTSMTTDGTSAASAASTSARIPKRTSLTRSVSAMSTG